MFSILLNLRYLNDKVIIGKFCSRISNRVIMRKISVKVCSKQTGQKEANSVCVCNWLISNCRCICKQKKIEIK